MPPVVQTLPNGLRIVTEQFPHAASVAVGLWLIQGARDEQDDECGMTHFCEHLLFKGTGTRHWRDVSRSINLLGGQFNAATCTDWVKVYGHVIGRDLEEALVLLADLFTRSVFPVEEVERERQVILEEIAMYEDIPDDLCAETLLQALMLPHPVGRPVIGTAASVAGFTRDELMGYWQRHLAASRLVLSVAGNVDESAVFRLAERELGGLPPGAPLQRQAPPAKGASAHALLQRPIEQVNFSFGWLGPSRQSEDRFAWAVYDTILGGGMGSRLFEEVREKRGLAYGIGSSINALDHTGFLSVYGSTRPETAALALEVCHEEVAKLASEGPRQDELETAIAQLERSHLLGMESLGLRNSLNGERLVFGLDYLSSEEILERLHAVDRAAVERVAMQVATSTPPALSLVGPLKKAKGLRKTLDKIAKP